MFGITDVTTYIIGTILIIILPLILILCTVLGAASLLHAFPWLFILLKVVGALYLSYLGIKLLIASIHTWQNRPQKIAGSTQTATIEDVRPYRTALTISLLNPKAILFYLSFFVQFVDPTYPYPAISFAVLSVILQIMSMSYLTILIFSGIKLASFFNYRYKVAATCVAAVGILFCAFGLKLASATL